MILNIGIDIDDTITCTYQTLLPMLAVEYGLNINKLFKQKPTYKMLSKIIPNYDLFVKNKFSTMAKIVPLRDGVVEVLKKLREEGHKIIFITARTYEEYDDPFKISYEYLDSNNVQYDKLIVNVTDKAKCCIEEKIDLFIDDSTNHCKMVQKSGITTYQFDTIFTKNVKELKRVKTWYEVYNIVQNMTI